MDTIINQLAEQLHGTTEGIENLNIDENGHIVFFTYCSQQWAANLSKNNKNVKVNSVTKL